MSEANCVKPEIALPTAYDSWVLSKVLDGQEMSSVLLQAVGLDYQKIAKHLAGLPKEERKGAFDAFKGGSLDHEAIEACLRAVPGRISAHAEKERKKRMPASARDLSQSANGVPWFWTGWISRGRISGLAGFEGTGKTRFALDLARRAYHGLPAPDGQALGVPAGSPSLWICADGHQDELAGTAKEMGIPPEAILFNAPQEDPYDGVDLDSEDSLRQLEEYLLVSKAPLVFVDTLTNATHRDLCRQSDVKSLLVPILAIAQRRDVAIILLLHLSREGQALGRRVKGLTRTLLHLECPDPDGQPGRLRLWVEKTFTVKPPPLGVTMGTEGNEYDTSPPGKADRSGIPGPGRPPDRANKGIDFLVRALADGDRKACELIAEWEAGGGVKRTLYRAKEVLAEAGRLVVDDSAKPLLWHLVKRD